MTTKTALLATLMLTFTACEKDGETSRPPSPSVGGSTEPSDPRTDGEARLPPGAPDVQWADKTFQQRKEWMGIEVLPTMKALFKEHDEAQFKGFGCDTCHGEEAKEVGYEMPTDFIYPLPKDDPVGASMDYDEEITKFMVERVVPEMAAKLDMEPYNPETGQGFGCFGCHPAE